MTLRNGWYPAGADITRPDTKCLHKLVFYSLIPKSSDPRIRMYGRTDVHGNTDNLNNAKF